MSESGSDDPETEHDGARTDGATGEASEPEPEVKEGRERAAAAVVAVQRKKGVQLVMEWCTVINFIAITGTLGDV